jgi:hypothetical protein
MNCEDADKSELQILVEIRDSLDRIAAAVEAIAQRPVLVGRSRMERQRELAEDIRSGKSPVPDALRGLPKPLVPEPKPGELPPHYPRSRQEELIDKVRNW